MEERVKLIFSGKLARYLLQNGYQIIDIKPHKENHDKTVFIFSDNFELKEAIERYKIMQD